MEGGMWLRAALAFCVVLGLIGLFSLALKKFGGRVMMTRPRATARLSVVEALGVAPGWRLLLVRRDTVEHTLLLGPEGAVVVERGMEAEHETR